MLTVQIPRKKEGGASRGEVSSSNSSLRRPQARKSTNWSTRARVREQMSRSEHKSGVARHRVLAPATIYWRQSTTLPILPFPHLGRPSCPCTPATDWASIKGSLDLPQSGHVRARMCAWAQQAAHARPPPHHALLNRPSHPYPPLPSWSKHPFLTLTPPISPLGPDTLPPILLILYPIL